jgi:hypothetical protein
MAGLGLTYSEKLVLQVCLASMVPADPSQDAAIEPVRQTENVTGDDDASPISEVGTEPWG